MNATGYKMLEILKELRDECGCVAVKAEFEAEGSRTDEMIMLTEVLNRADMPLTVKIGGCEAVRDLDQCKLLGACGIMAPMIETPFALSKFKGAAKKVYGDRLDEVNWVINAETKTCHENYDEILEMGKGFVGMIGIGRVDYSGSLGLTRADINNQLMLERCIDMADRAHDAGMMVAFGGGISFDAIPFIKAMKGHADRFETRKVHFELTDDEEQLKKGILLAMKFETLYLEAKCDYYDTMAGEDRERLVMMRDRVEKAEALVG